MSQTTLARRRTQESGFPTLDPQIPTLSQMIADGQVTADKIKRMTEGALLLWFNQSGRLCIARKHYNLRGARFSDFADRMGIERSNAFKLAKLWQHRHAILKRCREEGKWYGWETTLYWHEKPPARWRRRHQEDGRPDERRTPIKLFERFGGDCDLDVAATAENAVCREFFTKVQDGLKQKWRGGDCGSVETPSSDIDSVDRRPSFKIVA